MSLLYVIDGYNITHHRLFQPNEKSDNPRLNLVTCIASQKLTGSQRNRVVIVFDGYPLSRDSVMTDTSISCVYSGDKTADERIKEIVEARDNRRNVVVVSDDKEIMYFARAAHCTAMSVEEFLCKNVDAKIMKKRQDASSKDLSDIISYSEMSKINKELREKWLK